MTLYTIGFSKKNLREFITRLKKAGVSKIVDVRLNNTSQLAGYAKKQDLEYILDLVGIAYEHRPDLAPTEDILKGYKQKKITWNDYEKQFKNLLTQREPLKNIYDDNKPSSICLLCSEDKPKQCHRRLVAEYFLERVDNLEIKHL
ncbi:MAG: DUF488 family protein [Bacillota bacterium]